MYRIHHNRAAFRGYFIVSHVVLQIDSVTERRKTEKNFNFFFNKVANWFWKNLGEKTGWRIRVPRGPQSDEFYFDQLLNIKLKSITQKHYLKLGTQKKKAHVKLLKFNYLKIKAIRITRMRSSFSFSSPSVLWTLESWESTSSLELEFSSSLFTSSLYFIKGEFAADELS
jgi:hypothetical protein